MARPTLTRRRVLRSAMLATATLAMPFVRSGRAGESAVPSGKIVLAWHTNIASRWLDPQQHDGTASPDNLIMALHDGLIKNFREVRYDHPALAESNDPASRRAQVSRRQPGHARGREMELRALSRCLGRCDARQYRRRRDHRRQRGPLRFQAAVSRFSDPVRH